MSMTTSFIFSKSRINEVVPLPNLPHFSINLLSKLLPIPKESNLNLEEFAPISSIHFSLSNTSPSVNKKIFLLKLIFE